MIKKLIVIFASSLMILMGLIAFNDYIVNSKTSNNKDVLAEPNSNHLNNEKSISNNLNIKSIILYTKGNVKEIPEENYSELLKLTELKNSQTEGQVKTLISEDNLNSYKNSNSILEILFNEDQILKYTELEITSEIPYTRILYPLNDAFNIGINNNMILIENKDSNFSAFQVLQSKESSQKLLNLLKISE
ncbi:hypothetical protein [Clostridium amazonitimonense]|uniref:hypothetical protein n=1 Tax=Clostridium amazonitimonense TaxID=1499689 RepID=UPI000509ADB9|nr:hypothetical protein [Clostridium amazonitimonense]